MSAVVDAFQAQIERLAARTEAMVMATYAQLTVGEIDTDTTVPLIAAVVNRANAAATALADVWLAVQIEVLARRPVPTIGVIPTDDSERLIKAATTVLTEGLDDAETRLARLGRAEPLEAACWGTHDAVQKQPLVEGWVRQFDADPCQLCVWWWREGRVWPKAHPMPRHKGCNCQPRVVLREGIQSTGYTRRLRNAG